MAKQMRYMSQELGSPWIAWQSRIFSQTLNTLHVQSVPWRLPTLYVPLLRYPNTWMWRRQKSSYFPESLLPAISMAGQQKEEGGMLTQSLDCHVRWNNSLGIGNARD